MGPAFRLECARSQAHRQGSRMSDGGPADRTPGALIGRTDDLEFTTACTDQAARTGGALLLSGEAGVGKTVLLDAAAVHAEAAGRRALRAAGGAIGGAGSFPRLPPPPSPLARQ